MVSFRARSSESDVLTPQPVGHLKAVCDDFATGMTLLGHDRQDVANFATGQRDAVTGYQGIAPSARDTARAASRT